MDETMLNESKEHISSGFDKYLSAAGVNTMVSYHQPLYNHNFQLACKYTKERMDQQFGPSWHIVMGEGFSFDVTRQAGNTLYLYYGGKVAVLLFKC